MLAIGQNHVGLRLERRQVAHHRGIKKIVARQGRLIHHHRNAFGLYALHDALNGAGTEIVAALLVKVVVQSTPDFELSLQTPE